MNQWYYKYGQAIQYLIFGVLTTLVNIVVFFLLEKTLPYLMANAIAIVVAILFAFYTNKKFVFQSISETKKEHLDELIRFVGFRLFSGLLDMISMWILIGNFKIDTSLAKIVTQILVFVLNYVFSKYFVFKNVSS